MIELILKSYPKKTSDPNNFTNELYQTFKIRNHSNFRSYPLREKKKQNTPQFHEGIIILTLNSGKEKISGNLTH